MSQSEQRKQEQKVVQYLDEAHATEQALVRVLQAQIAMTPRGSYRIALETHLGETRDHARRVRRRLDQLGHGSNPLLAVAGAVETVVGQVLALGKTPLDLLRGSGREEKVLKNAKDACATEALEIATYTAIERLARAVGDDETAKLAASIVADEQKMLQRILSEIPALTDAVVAPESDLATARYSLRGDEPWPGYDELTVAEVQAVLSEGDDERVKQVRSYERSHKNRAGVLTATDRERSSA
jgi:ferritin-like metal-binding protein YciE